MYTEHHVTCFSSSTTTTCASKRRDNSSSKRLEARPRLCSALASLRRDRPHPGPTHEVPITTPIAAQSTELPVRAPGPVEPGLYCGVGRGSRGRCEEAGKAPGNRTAAPRLPPPEGHSREVQGHRRGPGVLDSGRKSGRPALPPPLPAALYFTQDTLLFASREFGCSSSPSGPLAEEVKGEREKRY